MIRKSQDNQDIIIQPIPMMLKDGTQATSLDVSSFTTAITQPDGTLLSSFTTPTVTNPNSDGAYSSKFLTASDSKAFTLVNEPNPYMMTLDHPETDVEPMSMPIWITDRYEWELAKETSVGSNATALSSLAVQVSSLTTTKIEVVATEDVNVGIPRIEANDTFRFSVDAITAPSSGVKISIFSPASTVILSLATATQSAATTTFFYDHTTTASWYTTVDSSGNFYLQWTITRTTGDDIERDYFEVIRTN